MKDAKGWTRDSRNDGDKHGIHLGRLSISRADGKSMTLSRAERREIMQKGGLGRKGK